MDKIDKIEILDKIDKIEIVQKMDVIGQNSHCA